MTVLVIPVGDSITMGSPGYTGGFRRHLVNLAPNLHLVGRQCVDATYGYTVGHHEGYSGAQTTTFPNFTFVDAFAPEIMLLSLGTNDLSGGKTPAQALTDVVALATLAAQKSYLRKVLVGSIPPRPAANPKAADTDTFNAGFLAAFAGANAKISAHLIGSRLNPNTDLADGLHPNEATGYPAMGRYWYGALRSVGVQTEREQRGTGRGAVW